MITHFLRPLHSFHWLTCDFIEAVPGINGTLDREQTLASLTPEHARRVAALGFHWNQLCRAEQIHETNIATITSLQQQGSIEPAVDGLVTCLPSCLLGIYVADCAAIYLADPQNQAIGLIHSGKRGTQGRILPRTITTMQQTYGTNPADLIVVVSPCIHPPAYEFDIPSTLKKQATEAGIHPNHYFDAKLCTYQHPSRFYSYRRDQGATGRMLALLGIHQKK